jgi:glycosyltransferase involved in cell wall biosynthesis
MGVPRHDDIEFKGFVSAEEKFRLMAGAALFVSPSPNESFSIVTLEAMAQNTPVLVNGACEVLADHVKDSGAGRIYRDYDSFAGALSELVEADDLRAQLGKMGRDYVTSRYETAKVQNDLLAAIAARVELVHS